MENTTSSFILRSLLWISLCIVALPVKAEEDVFDRRIHLSKSHGTIYQLLGNITRQTGYLFIYDSNLIDNEKHNRIKAGDYSIRQAIHTITGNKQLTLRLIGQHILLSLPEEETVSPVSVDETVEPTEAPSYISVEGVILDQLTREVIPYAAVGIKDIPWGTISNLNGEFRLMIPDSLDNPIVQFTHLGYLTHETEADLLLGGHQTIALEPKVVPIQEVIVRMVNPHRLLEKMMERRKENYSAHPVYHTTFYREGITRKNNLASLTEAVFQIYKSPYNYSTDQVKLLKMRNITNEHEKDTLITKFKSGIQACLLLDLIKHPPLFLSTGEESPYKYLQTDIAVVDNRLAYVISFESVNTEFSPLYSGQLFIDTENEALVSARFEIDPRYVKTSSGSFITRKSKDLTITPQKIIYTVSYKQWNNTYYINHIRGDLHFRIRKKKQLFNTTPIHIWFEMATCKTDTANVTRLSRNEAIATRTVFSETNASYDASFWEHFNFILPEEQLHEAIGKISSKIEEIAY